MPVFKIKAPSKNTTPAVKSSILFLGIFLVKPTFNVGTGAIGDSLVLKTETLRPYHH
jgi:hypothetical protein